MAGPTKRRSSPVRLLRRLILLVLLVLLLPYGLAVLYRSVDPVSTLMLWRWVSGQRVERIWEPLSRMGQMPISVIVAEDARFCTHHGVDFQELQEAIAEADDLNEARGGSTITQQTVKNLFLWNSRSFVRKGLEFPLALWIERVMPKRRILEIYLNIVEFGPNGEFGAEAGARRDFGKSAAELNPSEAAMLAAVLPNPRDRDARRPGPGLRRLGAIYRARAVAGGELADCLRGPRAAP